MIPTLHYFTPAPRNTVSIAAVAYTYVLLAIISGIILALIGTAAYLAPTNHWEFDIRYLWLIVPIPAPWLLFIWLRRLVPRRLLLTVSSAYLILIATIIMADRFNVIVNYDVWISRGMPMRWGRQ